VPLHEIKNWLGLDTASNNLGGDPGGLLVGDNILALQKDKLEPRPGLVPTLPIPNASEHYVNSLFVHLAAALAEQPLFGTTDNGDLLRAAVGGTTWSTLDTTGTFRPPGNAPAPTWAALIGASFVSTAKGIKKIDNPAGTFVSAGQTPPPALIASISGAGSPLPLNGNAAVSYRATLAHYDANGILVESSPTARTVFTNPSASAATSVAVNVLMPPDAVAGFTIIRLYRSKQFDQTVPTVPDDLHYLVAQRFVQVSDLAGIYSAPFIDNQPDALLFQTQLYTNTIGVARAYAPPPMAQVLETYRNRMWFGNTREPGVVQTYLIGTGTSTSISVGDTVTVAGITFTAIGATPAFLTQFVVSTLGTAAQNIEATARDLCRAINFYFDNPANPGGTNGVRIFAQYTSGFNAAPGQITFTEFGVGAPAWTVTSTKPAGFVAPLPLTSDATVRPARVYYSEDTQPDAVPILNYLDVGDQGAPILTMTRIGQALFVHKTDGLWKITGYTPSDFVVTLVSNEVKLVNAQSVARFSNYMFCLTRQGVYAVAEAGVTPVSQAIDDIFQNFAGVLQQAPQLTSNCWAVGKEVRHFAVFGIPASIGDVGCSVQLVYCTTTGAWTTWSKAATWAGFADRLGQLQFTTLPTSAPQGRVLRESVRGDQLDLADERVTITGPPAGTGLTWSFTASAANAFVDGVPLYQVGGIIQQTSGNVYALITGVSYGALSGGVYPITLTFDAVYPWAAASCTYYRNILATVRPIPLQGQTPLTMKDWRKVYIIWLEQGARNTLISLSTELTTTDVQLFRPTAIPVAFGTQPFGTLGFGGKSTYARTEVAMPTPGYGKGALLNLTLYIGEALQPWALGVVSALYEDAGDELRA
jgi:hypothetical protein